MGNVLEFSKSGYRELVDRARDDFIPVVDEFAYGKIREGKEIVRCAATEASRTNYEMIALVLVSDGKAQELWSFATFDHNPRLLESGEGDLVPVFEGSLEFIRASWYGMGMKKCTQAMREKIDSLKKPELSGFRVYGGR